MALVHTTQVILFIVAGTLADLVAAQDGLERATLPNAAPLSEPWQPEFDLPLLRQPDPGPEVSPEHSQAVAASQVLVRRVRFEGNRVVSDEELQQVAAPFVGRAIDFLGLESLRVAVTRYYVDQGYIASGATIPDQEIKDGELLIQVHEGSIADLELSGLKHLPEAVVRRALGFNDPNVLHLPTVQDQLHRLLMHPLVGRVDAEVLPGEQRGESTVRAHIEEKSPYRFNLSIGNTLSPSLGGEQVQISMGHLSVTGRADPLTADLRFAQGFRAVGMDYSLPINASDFAVVASLDLSDADVVEQPFDEINVESRLYSARLGVDYSVYQSLATQLGLELALDRRRSETFLLGSPFSFSEGVRNGKSDITALRLSQDLSVRYTKRAIALRSTLSVGLDAIGSSVNSGVPDSRFFTWMAQLLWLERLPWDDQLVVRLDGQLTGDDLLPLEKFAVGGMDSVRGYRQVQLVRDRGFAVSAEYRHRILADWHPAWVLELAPFVDYGGAFNAQQQSPEPSTLASIGLGLRMAISDKLQARCYGAHALSEIAERGEDLQDQGLHFEISGQFF